MTSASRRVRNLLRDSLATNLDIIKNGGPHFAWTPRCQAGWASCAAAVMARTCAGSRSGLHGHPLHGRLERRREGVRGCRWRRLQPVPLLPAAARDFRSGEEHRPRDALQRQPGKPQGHDLRNRELYPVPASRVRSPGRTTATTPCPTATASCQRDAAVGSRWAMFDHMTRTAKFYQPGKEVSLAEMCFVRGTRVPPRVTAT